MNAEPVNTAVDRAVAAWPEAPEWLLTLARECDASSVRRVAADLDVSAALVSRALNNRYHAPLVFLQQKVEGCCFGKDILCPVLGTITGKQCFEERSRPFSSVNPIRVQLARTCPYCEHHKQ